MSRSIHAAAPVGARWTVGVAAGFLCRLPGTRGLDLGAHAQDDLYERRRRYWEDRVERRIDEEEGLDDEDKADSTDKKDKTGKKDKAKKGDDDEDSLDQEEELIERRREQWRKRVEDEW